MKNNLGSAGSLQIALLNKVARSEVAKGAQKNCSVRSSTAHTVASSWIFDQWPAVKTFAFAQTAYFLTRFAAWCFET